MEINFIDPPREFCVGLGGTIRMKDCAHIFLGNDEQVTLKTESGAEYDLARKSWGFYATPSLNGRLDHFGLRAVLVKSSAGKYFIFLVERGKEVGFIDYLSMEKHRVVVWLDSTEALESVETRLGPS